MITKDEVVKIAKLANLTLTNKELDKFTEQFSKTIEAVDQLSEIDTDKVEITSQVTKLVNVWREDEIDKDRIFNQEEALSQAKEKHDGYFVVGRLIE